MKKPIKKQRKKLAFEPNNFRIDSKGWKKIKSKNGVNLKVNAIGDVWELLDGEGKGDQKFTWDAAEREAKKQGKRIPTDEQFTELLKTKEDMPNIVFSGYRGIDTNCCNRGTNTFYWSSSQDAASIAWNWHLSSSYSTVFRNPGSKAYGFSVRCLKD